MPESMTRVLRYLSILLTFFSYVPFGSSLSRCMFIEGFALISNCHALRFVSNMMSNPMKWKTFKLLRSGLIKFLQLFLRKGMREMIVLAMVSLIYLFMFSMSIPFSLASFYYTFVNNHFVPSSPNSFSVSGRSASMYSSLFLFME